MPIVDPIQIVGLRETVRALRAVDADLPKAMRLAANEAAGIVVVEARRDVPRRSGKAAASIRAKSTRTAARVTSGGKRAPYFPWLDYGGKVGRNDTASRPFIADGRFVYPAYRAKQKEFADAYTAAIRRIVESAGLEMT